LRYEAGGFNALHRDLRGDVFFPIQLAVVLSRRALNFHVGAAQDTHTLGEARRAHLDAVGG
jgi:hypothetical protein